MSLAGVDNELLEAVIAEGGEQRTCGRKGWRPMRNAVDEMGYS
jgi:hypothetical protein